MLDKYLRKMFYTIYSHPVIEWGFEFVIAVLIGLIVWTAQLQHTLFFNGIRGLLDIWAVCLFCLFLYKLRSLYKFDADKIKIKRKIAQMEERYYNTTYLQTEIYRASETITEELEDVALWRKDSNHRFMYLSRYSRKILFHDKPVEELRGLSDAEINFGCLPYNPKLGKRFREKDLETLYLPTNDNTPICNLTDFITQYFAKPCKYYEEPVPGLGLLVWKTPIYAKDGRFAGTVGALVDVSYRIEEAKAHCEKLRKKGKAFRIDNTENYYLIREEQDDTHNVCFK